MRKHYIGGALFASALALAGCGQSAEQAAPAENAANAAAPAEASENGAAAEGEAPAAEAGAAQNFTLVNNSGHTVMTLNVSPNDEDEWGPDILGTDTLAEGASGQISFARGQEQCLWDLRATFDNGETGDWRGVNLCETTTITLTPS